MDGPGGPILGGTKYRMTAISPFRHITWPTSVSIHDKTLKRGKIHHYNDIREIAKTPSSSNSSNGLAQNWYKF